MRIGRWSSSAEMGFTRLAFSFGSSLVNDGRVTAHPPPVQATLSLGRPGPVIHPNLYGHFAEHLGRCIYEGLWVEEGSNIKNTRGLRDDVVLALRKLAIPVLRWPGGCFADEYHWRDGIGPRESRAKRINSHWGGVVENNHFGTHEFFDLCEQIGTTPYICGNVGSGTVEEMMQWVEYMTCGKDTTLCDLRRRNGHAEPWNVPYFGVGNESWGCGGSMRPEYYADLFRRYNTFVKDYGAHKISRIACGANGGDYEWTRVMMQQVGQRMNGLSLHWYTLPTGDWNRKGHATQFDETEWHSTFVQTYRMKHLIEKHSAIMDEFDPEKRVGLVIDEWGTWYDVESGTEPGFLYQQNTLRDALVAGVNLNLFNQHCDRITMANIAQTVNVLQAMVLTDGPKMCLTPTYHAFEMYKPHQGARLVPVTLEGHHYTMGKTSVPMLHASASLDSASRLHVSVVNIDPNHGAKLTLSKMTGNVTARVLTAPLMNAHNDCSQPNRIAPETFTDFVATDGTLTVNLPPKSLIVLAGQP